MTWGTMGHDTTVSTGSTDSIGMGNVEHEISDESIIKAVRAGDHTAFAQLVGRHKRRVFRLAARFARDGDEQEDICQTVFLKVYEHLPSFRNDAPFEHWLTRITVRCCHDALRGRRHEKTTLRLDDQVYDIRDNAERARHEARQARNFLRFALSRLTADERLVITLLELEEFSVREIAAATGWSESNVKVRAHRARQALKRIVEEHDDQQA